MNTFALINIAKKDLGLDEEAYRMCLKRVTGEESLRVMSEQQREAVVKGIKAPRLEIKAQAIQPFTTLAQSLCPFDLCALAFLFTERGNR